MKRSPKAEIIKLKAENKRLKAMNAILSGGKMKSDDKPKVKAPRVFAADFKKAEKTVGAYFNSLKFSPSKGTIEIFKERYVLVRASALSYDFLNSFKKLYSDKGEDEAINIANNILFDLAHVIGLEDARNFHKKMKLKDPISKLSAGPIHFAYSGWAFVDILPESRPSPNEGFFLKYNHPFSFEADSWIRAGKKSKVPVCIMNSGYSSGWCEESFGIPLTAVEISCRAKGDKHCTFIMAPPNKIESYIKNQQKKSSLKVISIPSFLERKKLDEELKLSERHYREIFENASDMIQSIDLYGNIQYINDAWIKTLGYSKKEVEKKNVMDFIHPDYHEHCRIMMGAISDGMIDSVDKLEIVFVTKDKKNILVEGNVNTKKENGIIVGSRGIFRNITEKKLVQDKIKKSLVEKEVLLKEIHHRVKNNLQIISSLLSLQANQIENEHAKEKFQESIGRIKSMAIIHELLYKSKNLATINIRDYLEELVSYISKTYNLNGQTKVELIFDINEEGIDINKAIPCGIMINELLSNAFKYAFPNDRKGKITIEFVRTGTKHYKLKVSDDGVGLSKKINLENSKTLGLQLVNSLVEQVDGKIKVNYEKGTSFTIVFSAV